MQLTGIFNLSFNSNLLSLDTKKILITSCDGWVLSCEDDLNTILCWGTCDYLDMTAKGSLVACIVQIQPHTDPVDNKVTLRSLKKISPTDGKGLLFGVISWCHCQRVILTNWSLWDKQENKETMSYWYWGTCLWSQRMVLGVGSGVNPHSLHTLLSSQRAKKACIYGTSDHFPLPAAKQI